VIGGITNVPGTLASMTLGAGLRAAGASLRAATVTSVLAPSIQQGGESYFTAREQGAGRGVSAIYGILDTAAEAGGEYLGQREFLDTSHKGRSILTRWFRSQIPDVLGEEATTVAENTTAWLFQPANKDKTLADLAKEMPTSMGATLIQSLVGGGLSHITISGLETALDTAAARKRAEVRSQLGDRIAAAVQGVQDAAFIDQVERAAKGSKLNARDPETYAALMRQLANDNEVENVFVPAEAIVAYQQSDSYDQFDDPFADYQSQIDEAAATGGDVVLPADFALARLPGTTAWDAVRGDLRLRPGGMSMREAQEFQQNLEAHIKEASDRAASSDQADAAERDQRIAMVEARTQELQNAGFSPRIAGIYAELDVLRAAVRAQRNGRPLDPQDFGSAIRAVLPPALAEMQRADNLDMVINAMRKGKPSTKQGGKSLLEWIAARGGCRTGAAILRPWAATAGTCASLRQAPRTKMAALHAIPHQGSLSPPCPVQRGAGQHDRRRG
jgi:hypothetical protein